MNKEKRKVIRTVFSKDESSIKINLPFPKGAVIVKPVCDYSDFGASFILSNEEGCLYPGTPLKNIVFNINGKKIAKSDAVVIYAIKKYEGDSLDNKIGIQFVNVKDGTDHSLGTFPIRPKRYSNCGANGSGIVLFKELNGEERSGEIINLSKYGLAFSPKDKNLIFRSSQILNDFRVIVNNEIIYSGKATIANISDKQGVVVVGVSVLEDLIDTVKAQALWESGNIGDKIEVKNDGKILNELSLEYRALIADLHYVLSNLRETYNNIENNLDWDAGDRSVVESEILKHSKKVFSEMLSPILLRLEEIRSGISVEKEPLYRKYYQKNLHALLLESSFAKRVFEKPWGYPGDAEMIRMIYDNDFEGKSLFQKALHNHDINIAPASGVRNRLLYMKNAFKELLKAKNQLDILNLGCGLGREVKILLENLNDKDKQIYMTFIDFDNKVLKLCQEDLMNVKISRKLTNVKLTFIDGSIRQMVKSWGHNPPYAKQDLIYSLGLYDYFSDVVCKRLTCILYSGLKSGGKMILGNMGTGNNYRAHMELGGEWFLFHRDQNHIEQFAKEFESAKAVFTDLDDTKTNLFLNIVKQ